jgi:hypothetical protein
VTEQDQHAALILVVVVFVCSVIGCFELSTQILEVFPVIIGVSVLGVNSRNHSPSLASST